MSSHTPARRVKRIAHKEFQTSYIANYLVGAVTVMLAAGFSLTILTLFYNEYGFSDLFWYLAALDGIILLGILLMLYWAALISSHRAAGPLYRFSRAMGQAAQGDLSQRLVLRKKDQLKDLAEEFNSMTQCLASRLNEIDCRIEELQAKAANFGASPELMDELKELRNNLHSSFRC